MPYDMFGQVEDYMGPADTYCMRGRDARVTTFGKDFDANVEITPLSGRWSSERGAEGVSHSTYQKVLNFASSRGIST